MKAFTVYIKPRSSGNRPAYTFSHTRRGNHECADASYKKFTCAATFALAFTGKPFLQKPAARRARDLEFARTSSRRRSKVDCSARNFNCRPDSNRQRHG